MTTYHSQRHDIGITDADGNLIGMMLVEKNNVPQYSVFDDEYLASQFFTGVPGYGNLPPEKAIAMREDSHHAGFGQKVYDGNDPHRYFASYNADLRSKNQAILSYKAIPIPYPPGVTTPLTFLSGNMEVNTGWTGGNRSSVQKFAGSYSRSIVADSTYQDCVPAIAPGKTYTMGARLWSSAPNAARIRMDDGSGAAPSLSSFHPGTSAWVDMQHTFTANTVSTANLTIRAQEEGVATSYVDNVTLSSPVNGEGVAFAEFNDALYMAHGRMLSKLINTTSFGLVRSFPTNITDLEPFTDSRLYVALTNNCPYYSCNIGEGFIECSNTSISNFSLFKTVHSATPTMWGSDSPYTLRSNTNPAEGGGLWSGQTIVSSSYYDITELIQQSGALYIMKEDMPYYLDSVGAVKNDLAPELSALTKPTSGQNAKSYMGKVYIPCGEQALLESDAGSNRWLNPADFITNLPSFNGRVEALAYDDRYLFAVLNNVNTSVQVLAGRDETIDGVTDWRWHSIAQIGMNGCRTAYVSSVIQKRLWIAPANYVLDPYVYYIPLPTGYANITGDVNRNFQDGGYFITPKLHGNFRDTNKAFPELTVTMAHPYNAGVYWEAYYNTDSNTTWSKIADYTGTVNSMVQTNYLPDAGSSHPVATSMALKFVGRTAYTDKTPIMTSYKLNGILYPPQRPIIACVIRCANDVLDKMGQVEHGVRASIIKALDDARSANWPVSIRDIEGVTYTAKFLPVSGSTPRWMVVRDEKGREIERHYNVLMQVQTVAS